MSEGSSHLIQFPESSRAVSNSCCLPSFVSEQCIVSHLHAVHAVVCKLCDASFSPASAFAVTLCLSCTLLPCPPSPSPSPMVSHPLSGWHVTWYYALCCLHMEGAGLCPQEAGLGGVFCASADHVQGTLKKLGFSRMATALCGTSKWHCSTLFKVC